MIKLGNYEVCASSEEWVIPKPLGALASGGLAFPSILIFRMRIEYLPQEEFAKLIQNIPAKGKFTAVLPKYNGDYFEDVSYQVSLRRFEVGRYFAERVSRITIELNVHGEVAL